MEVPALEGQIVGVPRDLIVALGERALLVTADSETYPSAELAAATDLARSLGMRHLVVQTRELDNPDYARNPTNLEAIHPEMPLGGAPLGFPARPEDLFVDDAGRPARIDKAFSWEYPLAIHGMMHNVITNAWRGPASDSSRRCRNSCAASCLPSQE